MDAGSLGKLNMTVKGVSAAVYGMILETHSIHGDLGQESWVEACPGKTPKRESEVMSPARHPCSGALHSALASHRTTYKLSPTSPYSIFNTNTAVYYNRLPTFSEVYAFIYRLFRKAQVEPECLIAAVIYIEKLLKRHKKKLAHSDDESAKEQLARTISSKSMNKREKSKSTALASTLPATPNCFYLNHEHLMISAETWERVVFACIMIASKVWDDISCSSRSFSQCTQDFSLKDLNLMERIITRDLEFALFLNASDYKVYYYHIKDIWLNLKLDSSNNIIYAHEVPGHIRPDRWGVKYLFCGFFSSKTSNGFLESVKIRTPDVQERMRIAS